MAFKIRVKTLFESETFSFLRKDFFSERDIRLAFIAGAVVNIITWISILIKIRAENKPIPLHFNAFYGIEFVGNGFLFLEVAVAGLVILILNLLLAASFFKTDRFLARIIIYSGTLVQLLLLIAAVSVILLNS